MELKRAELLMWLINRISKLVEEEKVTTDKCELLLILGKMRAYVEMCEFIQSQG